MASLTLKSLSFIQVFREGKHPPGRTSESSTVDTSVAAWLHVVWADLGGRECEAWLSRTPLSNRNVDHVSEQRDMLLQRKYKCKINMSSKMESNCELY